MDNNLILPKDIEAQAYLAAIITSSDDAIISKDLTGVITSWNKSAERIFGYPAAEAIGKHITLIIPEERLPEEEKILATLKAGERVDHFETFRRCKDGRLIPVSITVSPIRDNTGRILGASKIARDISESLKAQQVLEENSRRKDEFLANMSHELRTPMNAVIGLASLLKMMDGLPDKAKTFIDTLKLSADNLMELISDLLDFAKIESGSLELEHVTFNIAELIERAISVSNVRAREKGLALYVNYASLPQRHYVGDPLRIHQVLMNLLSNAIKFTDKGSVEMEVSGNAEGLTNTTMVRFRITDTGIGIATDKLPIIFDKFTQADSSITRRFGGSGLGLAITQALVDKMNGTVHVESKVGVGTVFTVSLPLKNTEQKTFAEDQSIAGASVMPSSKKDVLLVEDYEPNIMVAGAILDRLGYDYDVAGNGVEALRKFIYGSYDIILMDVQMNAMDGLDATRRIRRMEAEKNLRRTPIIAMTAHVREQDKDKCLQAGMDDFIPKPFDPQKLAEKISRHIPANQQQGAAAKVLQSG